MNGELTDIRPTFIDLFSGCGGLSYGFIMAGWRPLFAVEKDPSAAQSYQLNFNCPVWAGLIEDFVSELENRRIVFPKVNAIIGGPPCQGFSPLGKMSAKQETIENHNSLNDLWAYFLRSVELLKPDIFITENVPEFIRSQEFKKYENKAKKLGYFLNPNVLNAAEFGVPQKRKRAFCIGSLKGDPPLPRKSSERSNVRDAIGHLPLQPDNKNWHIGRNPTKKSYERYQVIPPGGNRFDLMKNRPDITPPCWLKKKKGTTDVFGRLEWDKPASTIRTEFFKPEKGRYLHPEAHRPITHREAACIQTFPDSFIFFGSKIDVARQIGEAVPPLLAEAVAETILDHLKEEEKHGSKR